MTVAIKKIAGKLRNTVKKIAGVQNVNVQNFASALAGGNQNIGAWDGNWTTLRNLSAGFDLNPSMIVGAEEDPAVALYDARRTFMTFDTSSIPDDATIISARLKFVGPNQITGLSSTIYIVSNNQASNTSLALGDFDQLGGTSFGSIATTSISNGVDFEIALNATGIAAISLSGYTKMGARWGADFNNTTPTTNQQSSLYMGTVTLEVTYSYNDTKKVAGVSNV